MLKEIFKELDKRVIETNKEIRKDGGLEIPFFFIKVLGQTALIEASIGLNLFATIDVDAYSNFNWLAKSLFSQVLSKRGLLYDELSSEIWMPEETEYTQIFRGACVEGFLAKSEYIILSKLIKSPFKNRTLLIEYIAKGPSKLFLDLCSLYKINLEEFLKHV